jgi:large subunit ribosomal protein L22
MTGPKLNEKSYVAGERSGTKATAKYVRTSASKIRAVLDLVRGLDVKSADQILQLTERHTAIPVRKLLASAVANAVNNDNQDADELYVIACFADEGPTLKRFKPRARGRASRILKRTCHVTIIVARMSDDRISIIQARAERQGAGSGRPAATSRRDRVARSKQQAAESTDDPSNEVAAAEYAASDADSDGQASAADASPHGEGSHAPLDDEAMPEGYEIKANAQSMLFHTPDSRYYKATKAEVWFDTEESAVAAGFSKPGATTDENETEEAADAETSDTAADEAEEN